MEAGSTPVLVHNCEIGSPVKNGAGDPLVQATKQRRLDDGRAKGGPGKGNYGAALLKDGRIITGRSGGKLHAEEDLINQAGGVDNILSLYSERAPCANKCQPLLREAWEKGNLSISWSYRWNAATKPETDDLRAVTNAALKTEVGLLFGD